jgi:hypothetical protein
MPVVIGIAVAVWILLVLAVIGAVLVGTLVLSMAEDVRRGFEHRRAGPAWDSRPLEADDNDSTSEDLGNAEEWVRYGWSDTLPAEATAWWWSPGGSAPELVIDAGGRSSPSTVADKRNQIWTIHPDHTAHWQDDAADCPWCRNEPV